VRGIKLSKGDFVIGMVIADPEKSLLTVCENGYGKRTPFGIGEAEGSDSGDTLAAEGAADTLEASDAEDSAPTAEAPESDETEAGEESAKSGMQYRLQGRGGKGVRDIKTTARNGKAVDIVAVTDADEVLMVTASGKIQRLRAGDISVIGRNTQGVRIIRLEEGDKLVSMACIPAEIAKDDSPSQTPPATA
jgi:DNA gyrase subunit A